MATGMFSTKGMYALRAMADLASHEGWVSLGDVSKRQNISRKYLEQVISLMHKAGYVQSQRGKGGGYKLTRKPEEYTPRDLLLPRLKDAGGPRGSRRGLLRRHLQQQVAPARNGAPQPHATQPWPPRARPREATFMAPPAASSTSQMAMTRACSG